MAFSPKKIFPVLLVVALVGVGLSVWLRAGAARSGDSIRLAGNIEATTVDVSFKLAGRVAARFVDEGEKVEVGQVLARLDDADLLHQVALREAEVRTAASVLAQLEAGSRPEEIAQARAEVARQTALLAELKAGARPEELDAAQAAFAAASSEAERTRLVAARAEVENARMQKLFESQFISASDRDNAQTALDAAKANRESANQQVLAAKARLDLLRAGARSETLDQAKAALAQAEERQKLVTKGPRREEIDQARSRLAAAREMLQLARTQLGYVTVTSPLRGVCLTKAVEPGEYVNPGTPVLTVADLSTVWLRAYVDESDLGRVSQGMPVSVTTDSYPGKVYPGRVVFLASEAEFTPRSVQTEKERVKLVYRVKIALENPALELKPGMPAVGVLTPSSTPSAP